ncbi:MAG: AAA family ATPase, partial [Nitrospirota bacterium]|nr:AAA family ATPase [Nitrospirota bacterium]
MSSSPGLQRFFKDDSPTLPQAPRGISCPKGPETGEWEVFYDRVVTRVLRGTPSPGRHRLFDPEEAFDFWHALVSGSGEGVDRVRDGFRRLIEGRIPDNPADLLTVPLVPAPDVSVVRALAQEFPHFARAGVIEALEESLVLARAGDGNLFFPPILLLGDPGVGKTRFFRRMGEMFAVLSRFELDCAMASAGWILSGSSSTWAGSKAGAVFSLLATDRGGLGNPLIFLDELDKAREMRDSTPLQTLYTLLEPEGARQFRDEFFPIRLDASRILWMAAGNELSPIPAPIQSRFRIFVVPAPSPDEKRSLAIGIWRE